MALSIGQKVSNKKNGNGIIVKIITKSTGYVQVDFNGILKNEMAFNLNDEFGNCLKNKPASFADEMLGKGKAELWRSGKITLSQLLDQRGNPLTLTQLSRL